MERPLGWWASSQINFPVQMWCLLKVLHSSYKLDGVLFTYSHVAVLLCSSNQMTVLCALSLASLLFSILAQQSVVFLLDLCSALVTFPLSGRKSLLCARCPMKHPITGAYSVLATVDWLVLLLLLWQYNTDYCCIFSQSPVDAKQKHV